MIVWCEKCLEEHRYSAPILQTMGQLAIKGEAHVVTTKGIRLRCPFIEIGLPRTRNATVFRDRRPTHRERHVEKADAS